MDEPAGVVVGVGSVDGGQAAVAWGCAEANLHQWPLAMVHAWNSPITVALDVAAHTLAGVDRPAQCRAEFGDAAAVLLAQPADVLVIGGHTEGRHSQRVAAACLHDSTCPVVLIPARGRAPTGRVAVGICGTEASRTALAWAHREAQVRLAELVVVYAWQTHPSSARDMVHLGHLQATQLREHEEEVRRWVFDVLGDEPAEFHVPHGAPLDEMLVETADADLIVLGRSAAGPLQHLLHSTILGTDMERLANCPVAVVPIPSAPRGRSPARP